MISCAIIYKTNMLFSILLAATITVQGTVALPPDPETGFFAIATDNTISSQVFSVRLADSTPLKPGDKIITVCEMRRSNKYVYPFTRTITHLGVGPVPGFLPITASDVNNNRSPNRLGRIRGSIRDAVVDDIDDIWAFLTIDSSDGSILAIGMVGPSAKKRLHSLIGAEVELCGHISHNNPRIARRYFGQTFTFYSLQNLTILKPRSHSLFDAPDIQALKGCTPQVISASPRHRVRGQVRAIWNQKNILVLAENGERTTVILSTTPPPSVGDMIEVIGFPSTDLYTINLSRGEWRPISKLSVPSEVPTQHLSANDLISDIEGKPIINSRYWGQLVTIRGTVKHSPKDNLPTDRAYIEAGNHLIAVCTDSLQVLPQRFEKEATVEITGVCVCETESWNENIIVPRITDNFLVTRSTNDIVILKGPPFWTPPRFLATLFALLGIIVIVIVWNTTLRTLVSRKSHALLKEQIKKSEAEFRIDERTRLAIELHDSIAQDLTSVTMQVETATMLAGDVSPKFQQILHSTTMILQNCRKELRDCLWDLRNGSLDEKNMEFAIRHMLKPLLGNTVLRIRFNVMRNHILDATAHATLRIIRELVSNAVHHGKAQTVSIEGTIKNNHLQFSIYDDGIGFDINTVPGIPQGHFGLTGIFERVRKLNGSIEFNTSPGQGTKVSVLL